MKELTIQFISHACLKITGSFGSLICDPWILNEPVFNLTTWKFPPARFEPKSLVKDVDYLFITHSHEDHFHIPSLNYFSRDIPILLSNYDRHASLRAQTIEIVLRKLGFYNIKKLASWETVALDEHTELTCVPSAYTRDQDWENSGFILQDKNCTILNLNDNLNDKQLCDDIKERFPKVDIGFIQTGGVTMYPGCFKMSNEKMIEEAAKRKSAFLDQRRMLDFIKPPRIAPFAGDFCWIAENYFHQNWANRTTPVLMKNMLKQDYQQQKPEMVLMQPGDTWSLEKGHQKNGRRINWENYLEEITRVRDILKPKLVQLDSYLNDVNLNDLKERSIRHTQLVEKHITRDFIDFSARFRIQVEGPHSNFSLVTKASPKDGFSIDWNDNDPVEQTLYVPENIWACIIQGKLMWNIIQWVGVAEQSHFNRDMGRFWFWMEYHIDLNNKNIQAIICDHLWENIDDKIRPKYATFPFEGEWEAVNQFYEE